MGLQQFWFVVVAVLRANDYHERSSYLRYPWRGFLRERLTLPP